MAAIHVRVQPRSSRSQIVRREGDVWWIRLTAPPVEGKANAALLDYLGQVLGLAQSRLTIQHGHTGRQKTVLAEGLSQEEVERRLEGALLGSDSARKRPSLDGI